jgi:hypothetical protein
MNVALRRPSRGEIWFVRFPTDPPGKGRRPFIVVSVEACNRRDSADTPLVITPFYPMLILNGLGGLRSTVESREQENSGNLIGRTRESTACGDHLAKGYAGMVGIEGRTVWWGARRASSSFAR